MMERVAEICHTAGVRCLASLETPMACGIGICFSCVAKIAQPDGDMGLQTDLRRGASVRRGKDRVVTKLA